MLNTVLIHSSNVHQHQRVWSACSHVHRQHTWLLGSRGSLKCSSLYHTPVMITVPPLHTSHDNCSSITHIPVIIAILHHTPVMIAILHHAHTSHNSYPPSITHTPVIIAILPPLHTSHDSCSSLHPTHAHTPVSDSFGVSHQVRLGACGPAV